jgi:ribosomal protein S18 acetylase RimI-like enzyme
MTRGAGPLDSMRGMALTDIVTLERHQVRPAADILARAFMDEPTAVFLFPNPEDRATKSWALFAALLRFGMRFGEAVTTAGEVLGAAAWAAPGKWQVSEAEAAETGFLELPALIGDEAASKFFDMYMVLAGYHAADAPPNHWYGVVGGVAPEARGRWLGHALLRPLFRRVDEEGAYYYVETTDPATMALYTRGGGLRVVRDLTVCGVRVWTLLREPRSGAAAHARQRSSMLNQ